MIDIPQLTQEQYDEVQELRGMVGWQHVVDPITVGIETKQAALVNFDWKLDEDGSFNKKSIIKYKAIQTELIDLKQFLSYLEDSDSLVADVIPATS